MASNSKVTKEKRANRDEKIRKRRFRRAKARVRRLQREGYLVTI